MMPKENRQNKIFENTKLPGPTQFIRGQNRQKY